jgi:hypothetical protein
MQCQYPENSRNHLYQEFYRESNQEFLPASLAGGILGLCGEKVGKLESWRVGKLESWKVGELERR